MTIDHDQLFKRLIETYFREFVELFCPEEAEAIDFSRVEFLREEFFTDSTKERRKHLDLVAKVGLKAGGEKHLLIHVEFESSRKDDDFPRRMFQYYRTLFLRHGLDVLPIAVFTDDAHWRHAVPNHWSSTTGRRKVVQFEYELIKLKHLDYRSFVESNNPLAYALMAKMDYNRKQTVRLKIDFLRWILGSGTDPARENMLVEFVETYLPLNKTEQRQIRQDCIG